MKFSRLILLFLAIAVLSPALRAAPPAAAPAVQGTSRIAVVKTLEVYRGIKETKAMYDQLDKLRADLQAQDVQRRNELDALTKELQDTNPAHPSYVQKQANLDAKKDEYQGWAVAGKARLEREAKRMQVKIYEKIEVAVAQIAQQNGIDLVVSDNRQEIHEVDGVTEQALSQVLFTRPVVYSSKSIDLTELVKTVLDADFQKNGAAVPAPFQPQLPPATNGAK